MSIALSPTTTRWRPVVGYEDRYMISEFGEIKSDRKRKHNFRSGNYLSPQVDSSGYLRVTLSTNGEVKRKSVYVHRLVAEAFIGPRPDGLDVNHKDGNKRNNHHSNLEYVTHRENCRHAEKSGLLNPPHGERNSRSKLTGDKVIEIRQRFRAGETTRKLAREMGMTNQNIWLVVTNRAWKHIE